MKIYADLHVHSKYSRATSPQMGLEGLELGAKTKGINLIGTGDFTHPAYFKELKEKLVESDGFYNSAKHEFQNTPSVSSRGFYKLKNSNTNIKFCLSAEISCIYTKNGKGRRIHLVVLAPSLSDVSKINQALMARGANLLSDGRPILGMDAEVLTGLIFEQSPNAIIIPAHIWTPWFSLYGANSGFDSLAECFGKLSDKIYAVETGLSSDPQMNWRIEELDSRAIVSFSDSHSLPKLGRECTVLELESFDFKSLSEALKSSSPSSGLQASSSILYTIEFYPEEGKYHWTGHRNCNVLLNESEAKKVNYVCPKCSRRLTVGVMNRVEELANRAVDFRPKNRPSYKSLVPLEEIVAESINQKVGTGRVKDEYEKLISVFGSEFKILEDAEIDEIKKYNPRVAEGIEKVRNGNIVIKPGYDGVYGVVKIWGGDKESNLNNQQETKQQKLF